MALTNCPNCGNKMSTFTSACPDCGQPADASPQAIPDTLIDKLPEQNPIPDAPKKKLWYLVPVIIGIAIIAAIIISNISDTDDRPVDARITDSDESAAPEPFSDELAGISDEADESTDMSLSYPSGMYKVGEDIPAGAYLVETDSTFPAYIEVAEDSSGELSSIIMSDNFFNRIYITVEEGQYLSFSSGTAAPIEDAAPYAPEGGQYPSGSYLVGTDIPAGAYTISVEPDSDTGYGYYQVSADSSGTIDSIITDDNINHDIVQHLEDGQYLMLNGTCIQITP